MRVVFSIVSLYHHIDIINTWCHNSVMEASSNGQVCTQCNQWKTFSFFGPSRYGNGYRKNCRGCQSLRSQEYRNRNAQKVKEAQAEYKKNNRAKASESERKRRQKNKDAINSRRLGRRRKESLPTERWLVFRLSGEERAQWKQESTRLTKARYYHNHSEAVRAKVAKWRQENPDKVRALWNRRRARKKSAAGTCTAEEWNTLLERLGGKCLCCGTAEKITVDHVKPLSKGGANSIDNLQPLCVSCNSRKNAKTIDYRPK
jgi:5-methylcytosine-specific restriction endonuclease McrA